MGYARNGDCELFYETFGAPTHAPLLMINGLGSQCINFKDEWCAMFAAHGLFVIRFDNRDVGLSTHFSDARLDDQGACYSLSDMAADAIAVLDALGIERAHVFGQSLGGMIAQTLAIEHPTRLLTLTSIMSANGELPHGAPSDAAWAVLTSPSATDRESHIARSIAGSRVWATPEFADEDRWRRDAERSFDRCFDPGGLRRQFAAMRAAPPRIDSLRAVATPTLVIHGSADQLITPSGGRRTAELIPGARLELIDGMGHDHPPQLWGRLVALVTEHIASQASHGTDSPRRSG